MAQKKYQLILKYKPDELKKVKQLDTISSNYTDSLSLKYALKTWQDMAVAKSFYEASIEQIVVQDSTTIATVHIGPRYEWISLNQGNVDAYLLEKIGFRQKKFTDKIFDYQQLRAIQERLLVYLENNGYPFAKIKLDSIDIKNGKVSAQWQLQKGKKIFFDGIELESDSVKIALPYLEKYLGLSSKTLYEKQRITAIKNRLNELPFLSLEGEPYLTFVGEKAKVKMLLRKNRASRFDAVLGFLPSTNTATDKQKIALTGTLNLDLYNTLGKGERLVADFQRLRAEVQELKIQLTYPYFLNTNFGIDASTNIYRSEFTNIRLNFGVQYLFSAANALKIYLNQDIMNAGKVDLSIVRATRRLPERLDIDVNAYGIELNRQRLDYRFNPRRGWSLMLRSDIGTRIIRKNNNISELKDSSDFTFDFNRLYDSLILRSNRIQSQMNLEFYIPLFKQSTLRLATQAAGLFVQTPVYQNEQYRIGGSRVLRGFDEASQYATRYLVMTTEYRFLFGQNSYFNLFGDFAFIQDYTARAQKNNSMQSVGAGMTFETRAGLFSFTYALGKVAKIPFDLRSGKIHFGYISLF